MLRRINSALILEVIRARGPLSRTEIARATGLSKPTVNDVVGLLLEATYVRESLAPDGDGGRPRRPGPRARLLTFRADLGHVLGLDIGADKARPWSPTSRGASSRASGAPSVRRRAPASACSFMKLEGAGQAALAMAGVEPASLRAVGAGTPGAVDPRRAASRWRHSSRGWEGLEHGRELGSAFGCPRSSTTRRTCRCWASCGRAPRWASANALYVHVGVGIGGAILIDGEVYRGKSGAAGEIGYLLGEEDPEPPQLGFSQFEWAAGARAYVRLGARAAAGPAGAVLLELAGGKPECVTAELAFAAGAQGCPASREIVDMLAGRLGRGIANATAVPNPEMVIVGGGVSNAGVALRAPVERAVREHAPAPPAVVLSALGGESVAFDAVRLP